MIDFVIKDFPMAPSVNKSMMPVMGKLKYGKNGKPYASGRFVRTKEHLEYETKCLKWEIAHQKGLESIRAEIIKRQQELKDQGRQLVLTVKFFAVFAREKLYDSNGQLCRIDSDNRNKLAKDKLFRSLRIDDCHVFKDEIEKVEGSSEYMMAHITEYAPKSESQIKNLLGIKT